MPWQPRCAAHISLIWYADIGLQHLHEISTHTDGHTNMTTTHEWVESHFVVAMVMHSLESLIE